MRAVTAIPRHRHWRDRAACADTDPHAFFDPTRTEEAQAVCHRCPVQQQCLRHAQLNGHRHGVWGATTPDQR